MFLTLPKRSPPSGAWGSGCSASRVVAQERGAVAAALRESSPRSGGKVGGSECRWSIRCAAEVVNLFGGRRLVIPMKIGHRRESIHGGCAEKPPCFDVAEEIP